MSGMFIDASEKYKLGDFQLGKMVFFIPSEFAKGVEGDNERRSARTASGEVVDLAQLKGEAVFRIDDIRVEQLGWLAKNRELEYLVVKQKEGLVAVCVTNLGLAAEASGTEGEAARLGASQLPEAKRLPHQGSSVA